MAHGSALVRERASSAISPATVTPSFVIVGRPVAWASTTFRPRGPNVTLTVSATASIRP
jgi:hypothetical protein